MKAGKFATLSQVPTEVRALHFCRNRAIVALFLLLFVYSPISLRKMFLDYETSKNIKKKRGGLIHLELIHKENILRKGGEGDMPVLIFFQDELSLLF